MSMLSQINSFENIDILKGDADEERDLIILKDFKNCKISEDDEDLCLA